MEVYQDLRIFACDIIQNAGIILKLPQVALATAQLLFHRVYNNPTYTFRDHPIDITAMAAIFLAAKVEECPRKAREVIDVLTFVVGHKFDRHISLEYTHFDKIKSDMFDCEKRILKHSGFDLLSKYPHKILVNYYHGLVRILDPENNVWTEQNNKRIIQTAWNYCNDSLRSGVFSIYTKEAVVCACIHIALEDNKIMFPKSSKGLPWYCLFIKDRSQVEEAIDVIDGFYKRPKIDLKSVEPFLRLGKF